MLDDETAKEYFMEIMRTYKDRAMMKWNGFYLSDETEILEKDRKKRAKVNKPKAKLDIFEIDKLVQMSLIQKRRIAIQLDALDSENHYFDDLVGRIIGHGELGIYLEQDDTQIAMIELDQIRNIEILIPKKILNGGEWS